MKMILMYIHSQMGCINSVPNSVPKMPRSASFLSRQTIVRKVHEHTKIKFNSYTTYSTWLEEFITVVADTKIQIVTGIDCTASNSACYGHLVPGSLGLGRDGLGLLDKTRPFTQFNHHTLTQFRTDPQTIWHASERDIFIAKMLEHLKPSGMTSLELLGGVGGFGGNQYFS